VDIIDTFDWNNLRSADSSKQLSKAIRVIATSDCKREIETAYWNIDNECVVQGILYESALAVVCSLLEILSKCKKMARPYVLELIVQLISGTPARVEIESGNIELLKNIRLEVLKSVPVFLALLEKDSSEEEKALCIDILGVCALEDSSLKIIVKERLNLLNGDFENEGVNTLIENWLLELE